MKKILRACFLIVLLVFVFSGCARQRPIVDPARGKEANVILYYANSSYVETGGIELEKLIPVERTLRIVNNSLPLSILNELKQPPNVTINPSEVPREVRYLGVEQKDKILNISTQLPKNMKFLGVEVRDRTAYVNISSENLHGGSTQEYFILSQIIYSLTELDEIEFVHFLVDGRSAETLMGHYSIEEPLAREDVDDISF